MFRSVAEIEEWLKPKALLSKEITGQEITLERSIRLAEYFGNPQDRLKVIHIAGTSGKTSTCYFITSLIRASGKNVGSTVSPHIDSLTERVQINGTPIPEDEFCELFSEFVGLLDDYPDTASYFETMIVFMYWVFAKKELEYAVVETGLGGTQDTTNIAQQQGKVCVITDLGYDHQHVLGATIESIASHKAGIIWQSNDVFCYEQDHEVMNVIQMRVNEVGANLHILSPYEMAEYQDRNWRLAKRVFDYIRKRDGLGELTDTQLDETKRTYVPGRFDVRTIKGKTIIFDGAHNEQKMGVFLRNLRARYPDRKIAFLVTFKQSKDYSVVLPMIEAEANNIVLTTFTRQQDMPTDAVDPNAMIEVLKRSQHASIKTDPVLAFDELLEREADIYVVTGSFFLIAELRSILTLAT